MTRATQRLATTLSPALVGSGLVVTLLAGLAATAAATVVSSREATGRGTQTQSLGAHDGEPGAPAQSGASPFESAGAAAAPVAPARGTQAATVAPLDRLRAPDVMVSAPVSITAEQLAALQQVAGVEAVTLFDAGTVLLAGAPTRLVGVDPAAFRSFTPQETAGSDALWQSVAQGEIAAAFSLVRARPVPLGGSVSLAGGSGAPGEARVGAHASFGLPGVEVVTDQATARRFGVAPQSGAVLSAPAAKVDDLGAAVQRVLGAAASVEVLRPEVTRPAAGKPKSYRDLYIDSARYCPGLSWTVLAAIGQVESGHGRELGPSSAGALGPMQFLPSTWAAYGLDGDGDGTADIMNPHDAVPSAAGYLCRSGANRGADGLYDAIFAYNHADWYVRKVLDIAALYR